MLRRSYLVALILIVFLLPAMPAKASWEEGVAAYKSGDFSQAAREFQAVVDAQPEWAGGHLMLGQSLLKLKRNQEALTHLRKAYDLSPNDVQSQLALSHAYLAVRRYNEAAALLGKINERSLSRAQQGLYNHLKAMAMENTGRSDEALAALRKAAAANSNDAEAQYSFGTAALNAGETSTAVAALERAVSLDGGDAKKRRALISALIRQGRESSGSTKRNAYTKAVQTAKALIGQEASYDNLLLLGEAQLGAGQYNDAIGTFERAESQKPADWLPKFYVGQAHTATGSYRQAEASLQEALRLASGRDQRRVYKQLGFVYEKQKKFGQAVDSYTRAGDSAGAERARKNQEIADYNERVEEEQARYEELKRQEEELKKQLEEVGGGPPPR